MSDVNKPRRLCRRYCCVQDCINSWYQGRQTPVDANVSFFKAPANAELFNKWKNTFSYILKNDYVCERHFLRERIILQNLARKKTLRKMSCPVLECEENQHLMYRKKIIQNDNVQNTDEGNKENDMQDFRKCKRTSRSKRHSSAVTSIQVQDKSTSDDVLRENVEGANESENTFQVPKNLHSITHEPCNELHNDEPETFPNFVAHSSVLYDENSYPYASYDQDKRAHTYFRKVFTTNEFAFACSVCDRLWYRDDLKKSITANEQILSVLLPNVPLASILLCSTCKRSIDKNNIPTLSVYNGFKYPPRPESLPHLDLISERLISLYLPFRNEEEDILSEMKFISTYDDNEQLILQRRREFECNLDIQKTIEICRQLCREEVPDDEQEASEAAARFPQANPFEELYKNPGADVDADLRLATLNKLGTIAKKKENVMPHEQFCQFMRMSNDKQLQLLLHVIDNLLSPKRKALQVFFTGPAGCGKTFVIKLIMEIYNRFADTDGYCNAYITCASTGKAAIAIGGTTVHTALKISQSKLLPLSTEVAHQYRALFKYVQVLIIDEVSMIGAELLHQIDSRLKQITGNFDTDFGGLDVFLIGDLRQLPPVRATPIYKQRKQQIVGPMQWRNLKFYELTQVMRQSNQVFSTILTKIGSGEILTADELVMIESRIFTKEDADRLCPNGIRLFLRNNSVEAYNSEVLNKAVHKITSTATDILVGCVNQEQDTFVRQKLHKMAVIDTGGLPHEIVFVLEKPYMITTNIDVSDGLANGAMGNLVHIETDNTGQVTRVWLTFPESSNTGRKIRKKAASYIVANNLPRTAVPIDRRTSTTSMNNNKTLSVKRNHFPLVSSCSITIHKSQGSTYKEIVYEYEKTHSQQLLYVAISRVTNIHGLYITSTHSDKRFYHGRYSPLSMVSLVQEIQRLSTNRLLTITSVISDFISNRKGLSLLTINVQSLHAHAADLSKMLPNESHVIILSETWMNNEQNVNIPNFNCVAQIKRSSARSGGVAVYHNVNDTAHILTSHIHLDAQSPSTVLTFSSEIGELCATQCLTDYGQSIHVIAVYISPNSKIDVIIRFLRSALCLYRPEFAEEMQIPLQPIILSSDFNVNFANNESKPLSEFLGTKFLLHMANDPQIPTTRHGTTIDAVFVRGLENVRCKVFATYFSYHKAIASFLPAPVPENNQ